MDNARVLKELKEIHTDKTSGVSVVLIDEGNYRHMVGTIPGTFESASHKHLLGSVFAFCIDVRLQMTPLTHIPDSSTLCFQAPRRPRMRKGPSTSR